MAAAGTSPGPARDPLTASSSRPATGSSPAGTTSGFRLTTGGWVKNGSAGIVASVDRRRRTVTVDFHREGTITLPTDYLDTQAGSSTATPARPTACKAPPSIGRCYFAGDEASFEEGYVAFTRGRTETRLYLVDGTAATDDDTASKAHSARVTGLDTVAAALGRERANVLIHDADPNAAMVRAGYHGWALDQLRTERGRIETVLNAGPSDATDDYAEVIAERDAILALRRANAHRRGRDRARHDAQLDRALERAEARLATLEQTLAARGLPRRASDRSRRVPFGSPSRVGARA